MRAPGCGVVALAPCSKCVHTHLNESLGMTRASSLPTPGQCAVSDIDAGEHALVVGNLAPAVLPQVGPCGFQHPFRKALAKSRTVNCKPRKGRRLSPDLSDVRKLKPFTLPKVSFRGCPLPSTGPHGSSRMCSNSAFSPFRGLVVEAVGMPKGGGGVGRKRSGSSVSG